MKRGKSLFNATVTALERVQDTFVRKSDDDLSRGLLLKIVRTNRKTQEWQIDCDAINSLLDVTTCFSEKLGHVELKWG